QKAIVIRLPMPNVSDHRQSHSRFFQTLRRSRPADAAAIFLARVFGYRGFSSSGTPGEEVPHSLGELLHILTVKLLTPDGFTPSAPLFALAVGQAFLFGFFQPLFFDQQPLPFKTLPRGAPSQYHRRERRMFFRSSRQSRVAGGKIDQVIQVSACHAQRPL